MEQPRVLDIPSVQAALREFTQSRDWQKFHTAKNMAMALSVEASELLEIFQWLSESEAEQVMSDEASATAVRDELADVLSYVLMLADLLDVDLPSAVEAKIDKNRLAYPVAFTKGRVRKLSPLAVQQDTNTSRPADP